MEILVTMLVIAIHVKPMYDSHLRTRNPKTIRKSVIHTEKEMLAFPPRRRLHIEVGRIGHTETSQSIFRLIWFHDIHKNYRKI